MPSSKPSFPASKVNHMGRRHRRRDRKTKSISERSPVMIPTTTTRVQDNTDETLNERIHAQTRRNVAYFGGQGKERINRRLEELDREWDVERVLEANAASIALLGMGLGASVNRRFFALPAIVAGFLLQHA